MHELVYLSKNEAVCNSLQVAEKFEKRHDNVLRTISNLLKNEDVKKMFEESSYEDEKKEKRPMYLMNRDGFSLLVMGFTGEKALEWKIQYIKAFNKMESILRERTTEVWMETREQGKLTRKTETEAIKQLVEYAKLQGSKHSDRLYITYSELANKMAGIGKRSEASVSQLNNLTLIENIIANSIQHGIVTGKHYKEIYQECRERLELFKNIAYLEV